MRNIIFLVFLVSFVSSANAQQPPSEHVIAKPASSLSIWDLLLEAIRGESDVTIDPFKKHWEIIE
jgi:hypothetical protein